MPAILANRYQDVLAANPIARVLSPGFTPGQNFLRWRLLDPVARELYVDWDEATETARETPVAVGPCSLVRREACRLFSNASTPQLHRR
ncbi:MAG: hypothetical protein WBW75_22950 [Mycobacterium sp.]|uniref:MmyB family transcriptional regulator n=1 Tax=Mycobacterium sp. TaxID=1785 RepID=UPI003C52EE56